MPKKQQSLDDSGSTTPGGGKPHHGRPSLANSLLLAAVVGGAAMYWSSSTTSPVHSQLTSSPPSSPSLFQWFSSRSKSTATTTAGSSGSTPSDGSQMPETTNGFPVYDQVNSSCSYWKPLVPSHPQRFFDSNGHPKIPNAADRILTEYQYSMGTQCKPIARIDQTSVASNDPIEDRHR